MSINNMILGILIAMLAFCYLFGCLVGYSFGCTETVNDIRENPELLKDIFMNLDVLKKICEDE